VGIVATLRSWKGHRHLLEAFAGLADRGARLLVVGDGPQREALGLLAGRLGIAGRVRFAGNQADVAPWLQALDLFCLPSYANEGVPQALMQAMACGLPVISTPVGSIEIVQTATREGSSCRGRAGPAAIESLSRTRRFASVRANARSARSRFGEDRMVERMLDVFTAVARSTRRRPADAKGNTE
jgi:glycosyltransferase involved in cell wall biosynthesis